MTKRTAAAIAILVVLLGGALVWWQTRGGDDAPGADEPETPTAPARPTADKANPAPPVAFPQRTVAEDDDPVGSLRLEGQVIDSDGAPVGGANVRVDARPPRTAVSEDDGSFAFDELIERTYHLTASAGDLAGGPVQHALTANSDPAVIRLREGGVLEVEVVDANNQPVAGARVSSEGLVDRAQTTGADGVARLRGVPSGPSSVRVQADGYAPTTTLAFMPQSPGSVVKVRIGLASGAPVSGRVVDADGKPVAGARVKPRSASDWIPFGQEDAVETDANGAWRFAAMPAGTFRFNASHPKHAPGGSEPHTLDGKTEVTGVVIEVGPAATLSGKVVTADGAPAPYATVRIGPKDWNLWSGWDAGIRQVAADETGAFSFGGLKPEPIVASAATADATSATTTIDLSAQPHTTGVVLTLDVTGVISGVVVDSKGAPVAEASVTAWPDFMGGEAIEDWAVRGSLATATDGGGAFAFRGLPAGAYRLRAGRSGGGAEMFMLQPGERAQVGDTDVRLVLAGNGGVKGRVELDDGTTPAVFTVRVGWTTPVPVAQKDGAFTLDDIPAGAYDVTVEGPGFARTSVRDVAIVADEIKDLGTIVVKKGRSVAGRVVDATGRPVANANVVLGKQLFSDGTKLGGGLGGLLDAQTGMRRVTADERGDYRVSGVPKGESFIAAEHPDVGRSDALRVGPGTDDLRLDLVLRPFGSLQGTVTAAGEPVKSGTVMVSPPGQMAPIMVNTGADGRYNVDKLPSGNYAVTAMLMEEGMGSRTASGEGTVEAGKQTVIDIDIEVGTITLTVVLATDDGSPLEMAQIFLAPGTWNVKTVGELQTQFMRGGINGGQSRMAMGGKDAAFTRLVPGRYSACIIPFGGDMSDPRALQRIQEHPELLEVHCRKVTVADTPDAQTFETTVPAPKPLPPPEE